MSSSLRSISATAPTRVELGPCPTKTPSGVCGAIPERVYDEFGHCSKHQLNAALGSAPAAITPHLLENGLTPVEQTALDAASEAERRVIADRFAALSSALSFRDCVATVGFSESKTYAWLLAKAEFPSWNSLSASQKSAAAEHYLTATELTDPQAEDLSFILRLHATRRSAALAAGRPAPPEEDVLALLDDFLVLSHPDRIAVLGLWATHPVTPGEVVFVLSSHVDASAKRDTLRKFLPARFVPDTDTLHSTYYADLIPRLKNYWSA